jgi:predicted transcriptional regulator of viral defense system
MKRDALAVPPTLARRANRVLRPKDANDVYAYPRAEFARLEAAGVLLRIATGYYALLPMNRLGDHRWRPDLHAVALGIANADYGLDRVTLMGVSAARLHGAIPRAIGVAVVAVPLQRPILETSVGRVIFVKRDTTKLDLERVDTELLTGWTTTIEQTLLDLAARPGLGGLPESDLAATLRTLAARTDWDLLERLAADQHKPAALKRARLAVQETQHA